MANVIGQPARYVTAQVRQKRVHWLVVGIVSVALSAAASGFMICKLLLVHSGSLHYAIISAVVVIFCLLASLWCVRRGDELETERLNMQRGADGENSVSRELNRLAENGFVVMHDISTGFGNLDHVVIGPTGIFIIETKNWRGIVSSDGKGELLLNGQSTTKPEIRRFLSRIMTARETMTKLVPNLEWPFQALFVFVGARVEAKWGTTRSVHCMRDDQIFDYIHNRKPSTRFNKHEAEQLARAFHQLLAAAPRFSQAANAHRTSSDCELRPAAG